MCYKKAREENGHGSEEEMASLKRVKEEFVNDIGLLLTEIQRQSLRF